MVKILGLVQWRMFVLRFSSLGISVLQGTTARLAAHDQKPAHQVEFELNMKILTSLTDYLFLWDKKETFNIMFTLLLFIHYWKGYSDEEFSSSKMENFLRELP